MTAVFRVGGRKTSDLGPSPWGLSDQEVGYREGKGDAASELEDWLRHNAPGEAVAPRESQERPETGGET